MKLTFDSTTLELTPSGKTYRATVGEEVFEVEIIRTDAEQGRFDIRLTDPLSGSVSAFSAYVSSDGAKRWVTINGQTVMLTKSSGAKRRGSGHESGSGLVAPMPGLVRSVNVVEGEAVVKGQTLMVLEAMKMEIRIQAKANGIIKNLLVRQGQTVERDQILVEVE